MADTNKNIVITPNRGSLNQPNIVFTGNANVAMTLRVADDNSLSFENFSGQLFSIANNVTTGTIFSVNDISGIPFVSVNASGNVSLIPLGGANVGIGTSSPQSALDIYGNVQVATGALNANGRINGANINVTGSSAPPNGLWLPTTSTLGFATAGSERVRINSTGSVGIGTSSPTSQLEVRGNIQITNAAATISGIRFSDGTFISSTSGITAGSTSNVAITATTTNSTFYPTFVEATSGTLGIRAETALTYNPSTDALTAGQFIPSSATAPTNGMYLAAANTLGFSTNSTARATITSGGNLTVTGNIYAAGELQSVNIASGGQVRMIGGNYGTILRNDGSNFYLVFTNSGNQYGIWNDLRPFSANVATGVLNIDNTGAGTTFGGPVAVRTSTNAYAMMVPGTTTTQSTYLGTYNTSNTRIAYSSYWDGTNYTVASTDTTIPIIFGTNSSERMRIDTNGNIVIGSSTSSSRLYVTGTSSSAPIGNFVDTSTTSTNSFQISCTGSSNGVSLRLLGNGATTPSKYLRVIGGEFQVVNNAYSTAILALTDAGALSVTGEITAYSSDARLKDNISVITDALEKVIMLRGVSFDWNDTAEEFGFSPEQKHDIGVIAQELELVLPEAVRPAPFDRDLQDPSKSKSGENYLTVQYEKLTALLIEAVKELNTKVTNLENTIKTMQGQK